MYKQCSNVTKAALESTYRGAESIMLFWNVYNKHTFLKIIEKILSIDDSSIGYCWLVVVDPKIRIFQ